MSIEAINRSFDYNSKNFYVRNSFSTDILEMFSKDSTVSYKLDVIFQNSSYLELVSSSDNCCMFFQSCSNPFAVFVVFSEIFLSVLSNNLFDFVECFKHYKVRADYSKLYELNAVSTLVITCITMIYSFFRLKEKSCVFTYMYNHFAPDVDYSSKCLKIINRYYLDYVISKFNTNTNT